MSKRQPGRPKAANDFYPTPAVAVLPLLRHILTDAHFFEPCAGDGALIEHLAAHGRVCVGASDIAPRHPDVAQMDAAALGESDLGYEGGLFITNPPHSHELLVPILTNLRRLRPTWLLLPLDWCATLQAGPFMAYCSDIVVIGRMKIFKGTATSGYDNYVWARFRRDKTLLTQFHPKGMRNEVRATGLRANAAAGRDK